MKHGLHWTIRTSICRRRLGVVWFTHSSSAGSCLTTFAGLKAAKHPSASPCFLSNKARALATRSSSLSEDSIHVCSPRTRIQNNKAATPSRPSGCYTHGTRRTDSSQATPSGDDTERGDLNGCVSSSNLLRSRFFCTKNILFFSLFFFLFFGGLRVSIVI